MEESYSHIGQRARETLLGWLSQMKTDQAIRQGPPARMGIRTNRQEMEQLAKRHNLSRADVFEALIDQEYAENRRLKGKQSRRVRM